MVSQRVAHFGTSIFAEMSRLAAQGQAVNLGQGFPDFDGPEDIKRAAQEAISSGVNQYAVTTGAPALRAGIAAHAQRFYAQRVNPDSEVVVTSGATEALFDVTMAFLNPGDEAVLFEPFYDSYQANVQLAGGRCRYVELKAPDGLHAQWWFDEGELERAFGPRTKLVFLNSPHNPTGKVFSLGELQLIGDLTKRAGAVLVSDEVYEHLVFPPARHLRPATLPGFDDFTITISSGGKTFSFTGWKVGWAIGRAALVEPVQRVHQWVTFATAAPLQAALASALRLEDAWFGRLAADYQARRDFLAAALRDGGFAPLVPQGTYFIMARTDGIRRPGESDVECCRRLIPERGVAAIPPSVFYGPEHAPHAQGFARFAFCKTQAVLDEAARRLRQRGGAAVPREKNRAEEGD